MHLFNRFRQTLSRHDRSDEQQETLASSSEDINPGPDLIPKTIDAPYLLAHDLPEHNRLEFQHFFLKGLLGANYLAPIDPGQVGVVVDIGSGTGRWVIEMAQQFPQASITGLDITASDSILPSNALFVQHNALNGLPFATNSIDYVHSWLLVAGIPARAWYGLLLEYLRITKPGGWIELLEGGTTFVNAGPRTGQFLAWWNQLSQQRGIDAALMNQLPGLVEQVGIQNLQTRRIHAPIGSWGGRTGTLLLKNITTGWGGLRELFIKQLAVTPSEFDLTLSSLPGEWERLHTLYEYVSVVGQAPMQ